MFSGRGFERLTFTSAIHGSIHESFLQIMKLISDINFSELVHLRNSHVLVQSESKSRLSEDFKKAASGGNCDNLFK